MAERERVSSLVRVMAFLVGAAGLATAGLTDWDEVGLGLLVTGVVLPLIVGQRPLAPPREPSEEEGVPVLVPRLLLPVLRSRLSSSLLAAGAVASITVGPALLHQLGQRGVSHSDWRVVLCSIAAFAFPLVYIALGSKVIEAVARRRRP